MDNRVRADEIMNEIIGSAYPSPVPSGGGNSFICRWIVRSAQDLPEQTVLEALAQGLASKAAQVLADAYGRPVAASRIMASIIGFAPKHCVVSIESPAPGRAIGDDAAIITWTVLRGLDEALGVDDLEGIPKRFWFPMR